MNNEEWLKNLKKGDKVAVHAGYMRDNWSVGIVEKVTPTGRIVVRGRNDIKTTFDQYGRKRSEGRWDGGQSIGPIAKEMVEERLRKNMAYKISEVDFDKITMSQAKAVYDLLVSFDLIKEKV